MKDLIAKLKAATEGSRELDASIHLTLNLPRQPHGGKYYPPYTTSLDAALTLVPEGWWCSIQTPAFVIGETKAAVSVSGIVDDSTGGGRTFDARATTPALALSSAALKARQNA